MTGPLTGFKIIDLTSMVSGPLATMMLALPMVALYFLAVLIGWLITRRRKKR